MTHSDTKLSVAFFLTFDCNLQQCMKEAWERIQSSESANNITSAMDSSALANRDCCHLCKEAVSLEKEISQMENDLASLKAKRCALRTKLNAYHDPITSKFPPEVISNIFVNVLQVPQLNHGGIWPSQGRDPLLAYETYQWIPPYKQDRQDKVYTPLQLGSICRSWREIAWMTPQLWTQIALGLAETAGHTLNDIELLQFCLGRSGTLPLRINLQCQWQGYYSRSRFLPNDYAASDMIALISSHSERWTALEAYLLPENIGLLRCDPSRRPTLTTIDIGTSYHRPMRKICINPICDRLTNIILRGRGMRFEFLDIELDQVTAATLDGFKVRDCLEFLSRSPRLESLSITFQTCMPTPIDNASITVHKCIQRLELIAFCSADPLDFLIRTTFPALQEFKMDKSTRDGMKLDEILLVPPFRNSLATLKRMTLLDNLFRSDSKDIVTVLNNIPSLEYLELNFAEADYGSIEPVFERLSYTDEHPKYPLFLPNLKELYIANLPTIFWESVSEMFPTTICSEPSPALDIPQTLSSNMEHLRPLRSFRFKDWRSYPPQIPDHFDRDFTLRLLYLEHQGISFMIQNGSGIDALQLSADFHCISRANQ